MKRYQVLLTAQVDLELIIEANSVEEAEQIASMDSVYAEEIDRETSVLYGQTSEIKE